MSETVSQSEIDALVDELVASGASDSEINAAV